MRRRTLALWFFVLTVLFTPMHTWAEGAPVGNAQLERVVGASATLAASPAPTDAPDEHPVTKPGLEGLDEFITQAMKDWKVPGLAVAVVQDGKVVLTKGYGWRDIDKKLPVTPQTLFAIGSISKSFTVTFLGTLVDEGKLDWDKPVRDYLRGFRLYDPVASDHITPRDLVTHRSGLPRHDLMWYTSDFSRRDMVLRLRYLEPNKELRNTFQYNNLMFMTAGFMGGELLGTTWEEAARQRILTPLGMAGTNFSVVASQKSPDFAHPYKNAKGVVKEVPFHNIDQIGPAGSINSSVADMSRYLLFHLNRGKVGEKQLLSENNALQMQTPQMVIQGASRFKELAENSYGMGLFISAYRGHKLVEHGGAIDGFTAELAFLPQDKVGVVVLSDLDSDKNPLPTIVAYNVFDRLLGLDLIAWNQRFLEQEKKSEQSEEDAKKKGYSPRKQGTHPSHDLQDYAGDYENSGYGRLSIEREADGFKATLNQMTTHLRHYHYDIFEVPENPLDPFEQELVQFRTDKKGDISSVALPLEPNVEDIVFQRVAEKRMFERSFLEPFVGQYELPGTTLTVSLQGDHTLVASGPGQPVRELVPSRGTTFDLKGLNGFSIEFKQDAAGKVTEAVLYQLGETIVLKRK